MFSVTDCENSLILLILKPPQWLNLFVSTFADSLYSFYRNLMICGVSFAEHSVGIDNKWEFRLTHIFMHLVLRVSLLFTSSLSITPSSSGFFFSPCITFWQILNLFMIQNLPCYWKPTFEFVLNIQCNVQGVKWQHRITNQTVKSLCCHLQKKPRRDDWRTAAFGSHNTHNLQHNFNWLPQDFPQACKSWYLQLWPNQTANTVCGPSAHVINNAVIIKATIHWICWIKSIFV